MKTKGKIEIHGDMTPTEEHAAIKHNQAIKKSARVILTLDCPRNCEYCCNKQPGMLDQAQKITDLSDLADYDVINLTGGEPMLYPYQTLSIIAELRNHNPRAKIYLYTAMWDAALLKILDDVDGITFTLHSTAKEDLNDLVYVCGDLASAASKRRSERQSNRLKVPPDCTESLVFDPRLWTSISRGRWDEECFLPAGETLFILDLNGK